MNRQFVVPDHHLGDGKGAMPPSLQKEVVLDDRRRTSFARIGNKDHARYLAEEHEDGTIVLTPAVMISQHELVMLRNPAVIKSLEDAAANRDPAKMRRRRPPQHLPA